MQRSLFTELIRQQLITALIPIVMIGGVAALVIFPRLNDNLVSQHQQLAISVSDQVAAHLAATKEQVKLIALDLSQKTEQTNVSARLDKFIETAKSFETIYVTNADDKIIHIGLPADKQATRPLFINIDVSFSTLWGADQGDFSWSNIFISPISGEQSLALSAPLNDGKLIAEIDILQMPALAKSVSHGSVEVMILDEKATLIAHPNSDISLQQLNLGYAPLFTENTDRIRSGLFPWNGADFHATVVPLADARWQVVVAEDNASFSANIDYLIVIWATMAAVTLIVSIYFALRSARRQSQPFTELTHMTTRISGGDYDVDTIGTFIEEIEGVSEAVVAMANRIKLRELELTEFNKELEGRVEERTRELLDMNDELTESLSTIEATMEQLVQSEKLASLGSLVAGVAHELNTPIGNAKLATSSQQDYLKDIRLSIKEQTLTKSQLAQFIEDIDNSSDIGLRNLERAAELIQSFKQVAVDQTSSHQRFFSLATVVNEVLVTLRPTLKRKPVLVETHIPTSIEMNSLPGPVSQILTNLINNSVFHGLEDKERMDIRIVATEVEDSVIIEVSDTGVGIPEEHIKQVYDPFFSTKMGKGGSGLGLNIVHRMVTGMLLGKVNLETKIGEGTKFTLILPIDLNVARSKQANEMGSNISG